MNDMVKGDKVGTSSPLKRDTIRRLKTVALVCETSNSASHGLISAINKYEALCAVIGVREGFREVLEALEPLSDAVIFAKRAIRKREGMVVTEAMVEGLRDIIGWHAESCGAALEGKVYKFVNPKQREQTELKMLKKAIFLSDMFGSATTQHPASSPAKSSSHGTASASSRSRSPSTNTSTSSPASSDVGHISEPPEQALVFYPCVELASPGAEVVVARQPSTMVGLLVARVPGITALRRWCSRAVDVCVSTTARFWM